MAVLKSAPEGAKVLDLQSARAARAEARAAAGEGNPFIKLEVGYVELAAEIPLGVAIDLQSERLKEGLAGLLADPADVDALIGEITANDLEALTQFITGATSGE